MKDGTLRDEIDQKSQQKRGACGKYPRATDKEIQDIFDVFDDLATDQIRKVKDIDD